MKSEHLQMFYEEAGELIQKLELSLIDLEKTPDDKEIVAETFRALHTIKGSSGMFGFDGISGFTHDIENLFDKIRNNEIIVSKKIIDLTLEAIDQIKLMLNDNEDKDKTRLISEAYKELADEIPGSVVQNGRGKVEDKNTTGELKKLITYKIEFEPGPDIFSFGTNPLSLIDELKSLGETVIVAHTDKVPSLDKIDPVKIYLYWDIVLTTDEGINAIKDVFIFVEDDCKIEIKIIDEEGRLGHKLYKEKIEEILLNKTELKPEDVITNLDEKVTQKESKNNLSLNKSREQSNFSSPRIKVDSEKLDSLVNLVGELVTIQSQLTQTVQSKKDSECISIAEEIERLTWSMRDTVLGMRMIPIGTTFNQFNRLVRDLSKELGKKVILETEGAETELDKNVIEHLHDPLVHIIRNSIDHGIELPGERKAKGKQETGKIFLSAEHSGANVIIKIKDDGAGLNLESIKRKALQNEIINKNDELSEKNIYRLIFSAGFSTAEKVTNVSGRGVGLDVVAKAIESLRGSIDLESVPGEGSTIILKLPLTLAIIEGLLVKISEEHFIIPLSYVEECIELTAADIENAHGNKLAKIRGTLVPYISIREEFNVGGSIPAIQQIVVITENNNKSGLLVDEIIGEHQTVIKSMGKFIKNVEGLSGLTILGNGSLALILDVPKIIKKAEMKELMLV